MMVPSETHFCGFPPFIYWLYHQPFFLVLSCWSRMIQQLTSMPGHYLKPKGIWASLELHKMQQGRETGWGKYNFGICSIAFFLSCSHCPCNFFFLACFQRVQGFVRKHILQIIRMLQTVREESGSQWLKCTWACAAGRKRHKLLKYLKIF